MVAVSVRLLSYMATNLDGIHTVTPALPQTAHLANAAGQGQHSGKASPGCKDIAATPHRPASEYKWDLK
jgi:hypothetical protein